MELYHSQTRRHKINILESFSFFAVKVLEIITGCTFLCIFDTIMMRSFCLIARFIELFTIIK